MHLLAWYAAAGMMLIMPASTSTGCQHLYESWLCL